MSETTSAAPAARTYAHVINGRVVETIATALDIASMFPPSFTWYDVSALSPQPAAGWSYAAGVWTAPVPVAPLPPRLTSLEFMALLTDAEQTAIATAAQTNASVLVWLLRISGATYVDLGDPQTAAGVQAMVAAGLLSATRVTAILANEAPPVATASMTTSSSETTQ